MSDKSSGPELTLPELAIMKAIWNGAVTTRAIWESVVQNDQIDVAFSTVSTYLQRLLQKGHIDRKPTEGREYHYTAKLTKESYRESLMQKAEALYDSQSELLQRFTGTQKMDAKERERLEKIVERLKRKGN